MTSLDLRSQVKHRIATLTDPELAPSDLSLTNCDREPIQISNAIQAHGVMLVFSETDTIISQVSQNSQIFLGKKPTQLLGKPLSILMQPEQIVAIRNCLNGEFENVNPLNFTLSMGGKLQTFAGIVHRTDGVVVLELEPVIAQSAVSFFDFYKFVKSPIDRIQSTRNLTELAQQAVTEIRSLTGFDRVMLYRFDPDGSGHVIAENKSKDSESFLGLHYPAYVASGLLALRISRTQQTYLLWFRPEVIQTINWAGESRKSIGIDADNCLWMTPRKSFELWKETVRLKSLPWKICELDAALELRNRIIGIVLQKADELAVLNTELERSNIELDSFAYVASHDLKEPLRGIHNYSTFLIEDYGDRLGDDGTHKLDTLIRLTQRMEDLIDSLLHYSRCGRAQLLFQPVDLGELIESVIDVIKISRPMPVDFQIPRPLPTIECDRTYITELFTNLISNAIEYNDQTQKIIEIGYILSEEIDQNLSKLLDLNSDQTVFFVKDNGIGIRVKHLETIFKIFKRLHPANKYGGGTGAGLTISRKIVERHGGKITVASTFGEGSTFYFTLGQRS